MSNIIWKGVNSDTITGLLISELPPITKPKMRTSSATIDGVDGDIISELGYEAYDKEVSIGLSYNYDINEVIKYFTGKGELVLSNESDKYYKAQIVESVDYEKLINFKTAKVKFHCQPYKYLLNETPVEVAITTETEVEVENKGLEKSKPIITLEGTGEIGLYVNGNQIFTYNFGEDTEVVIDSEKQDAYLGSILKNRQMLGEFPILEAGENTITWTGTITNIKIEPKSRWI